jgi:hypothetical protein
MALRLTGQHYNGRGRDTGHWAACNACQTRQAHLLDADVHRDREIDVAVRGGRSSIHEAKHSLDYI